MEFHEFKLPIALQTLHFRQEDQLFIIVQNENSYQIYSRIRNQNKDLTKCVDKTCAMLMKQHQHPADPIEHKVEATDDLDREVGLLL